MKVKGIPQLILRHRFDKAKAEHDCEFLPILVTFVDTKYFYIESKRFSVRANNSFNR